MSFWSWLTGHDDKESDVYANFDKVDQVVQDINKVSTSCVTPGKDAVNAALTKLNSVKGLAEYVGTIPVGSYDGVFDSIDTSAKSIADQLNNKAETIKVYNESSVLEKIGSSLCMGVFKLGEGLLSVGESLIDGVASVVGWTSGLLGNKQFQDDVANFIKKDYSHDVFNFYYNSDFAKKSTFTEESAISGGFKFVGKMSGLLLAGGVLAGMGEGLGLGSLKVGQFASKLASSTTWGATGAGILNGLGSRMETELAMGTDYNTAFGRGAVQGAIQGAFAFAGGKFGEKLQKTQAIRNAPDEATAATIKATKLSDYQGYSDALTKAGQRFGYAEGATIKAGAKALGATVKSATSGIRGVNAVGREAAADAAREAQVGFINEAKGLFHGGTANAATTSGTSAVNAASGGAGSAASGSGASVAQSAAATGVRDGAAAGVAASAGTSSTGAAAGTSIASKAVHALSSVGHAIGSINPAVPGITAAAINAGMTNMTESVGNTINAYPEITRSVATGSFSKFVNDAEKDFKDLSTVSIGDGTDAYNLLVDENGVDDGTSSQVTDTTGTDTTGGSTSGGSSSGGPSSGGSDALYQSLYGAPPPTTEAPTVPQPPTQPPTEVATVPPTTPIGVMVQPSTQPVGSIATSITQATTPAGPSGTETHSGSGFSVLNPLGEDKLDIKNSNELENAENLLELDDLGELEDPEENNISSIDDVINGSQFTRVPSSTTPSSSTTKKKSSNSIIPIAAGLSAAAAAGLGAKAYLDHKNNSDMEEEDEYDEEYSDDDFDSEEWNDDEDTVEVNYNEDTDGNQVNDLEDEYYQDTEGTYTARTHDELADLE